MSVSPRRPRLVCLLVRVLLEWCLVSGFQSNLMCGFHALACLWALRPAMAFIWACVPFHRYWFVISSIFPAVLIPPPHAHRFSVLIPTYHRPLTFPQEAEICLSCLEHHGYASPRAEGQALLFALSWVPAHLTLSMNGYEITMAAASVAAGKQKQRADGRQLGDLSVCPMGYIFTKTWLSEGFKQHLSSLLLTAHRRTRRVLVQYEFLVRLPCCFCAVPCSHIESLPLVGVLRECCGVGVGMEIHRKYIYLPNVLWQTYVLLEVQPILFTSMLLLPLVFLSAPLCVAGCWHFREGAIKQISHNVTICCFTNTPTDPPSPALFL